MNNYKLVKKDIVGSFSELLKDLSKNISKIYFYTENSLLCDQGVIQKNSYEFLEKVFKRPYYNTHPIKMFITATDIADIELGLVDLSDPKLHGKSYTSMESGEIYNNNNKILTTLKSPFSAKVTSDVFTNKIQGILGFVRNKDNDDRQDIIDEFLNQHKKQVKEILNFCEIINLLCISQCLYAFCYQLSINANFARVIEIITTNETYKNEYYKPVQKLIEKLYLIFSSNLGARVFSEETLSIVEQSFTTEGA